MSLLDLPTVTLCAATSVNVSATLEAMERCLAQARFADAVLFTDAPTVPGHASIRFERIEPLVSGEAYSQFMLAGLAGRIASDHCLVTQWDGFIVDPGAWDPAFLDCDYVGAPWPQFGDGWDVGNGGFSLRSRRLIEACAAPGFQRSHPEDIAICRYNRPLLEAQGLRFAGRDLAARFAFERDRTARGSFGFHGVFNLPDVVGADEFWRIYCELDDPSTAYLDGSAIRAAMLNGRNAHWRRTRFLFNRLLHSIERWRETSIR